ncbi:TonB-dependent receptor [Pseudoalteromonas luteoviolacea B = ATCC 29581]|nr:TonB-dependent receptor [Pseudoalteromonas luteoviolacea B = ATCC 29581]
MSENIQQFTLTQIKQACYDSEEFPNEFCGKFRRDPNKKQLLKTDAYESGYVNAGDRYFRAMSIDALYKTELPDTWGELQLGAYVLLPQEQTVVTLGTPNLNIDEPGNAEIKANFTARWTLDDLAVTV